MCYSVYFSTEEIQRDHAYLEEWKSAGQINVQLQHMKNLYTIRRTTRAVQPCCFYQLQVTPLKTV